MDKKKRVQIIWLVLILSGAALGWFFWSDSEMSDPSGSLEIKNGSANSEKIKDYRLDTEIFTDDTYSQLKKIGDTGKVETAPGNKNPFGQSVK